jgi:hypothetical protein
LLAERRWRIRREERKRKDGFGWWFAGFWRIDREGE